MGETSGRGKRPGLLPRDCPIRRPSSFVSFSIDHSDTVLPFSSSRRFLLFYTVSYFVLSEEQNGDDSVDLSYFEKRVRDHVKFPLDLSARDRRSVNFCRKANAVRHLEQAFCVMDSSENLSSSTETS